MKTTSISIPVSGQTTARLGVAQSHLVFDVGSEFYACPINDIERLLRCADVELRPSGAGAPSWEAGRLMEHSGASDIPIVSLRALWGLPAKGGRADKEALLVVRVGEDLIALLVDACLSVLPSLPVESARLDLPAPLLGPQGKVFESAVAWQNSLLVILQIKNLLQGEKAALPERSELPVLS